MLAKRLLRIGIALIVLAGVGVGGLYWWRDKQAFEKTDNAYVAAETVEVAPQIEGYVTDILVTDNQTVIPGQVLVRLDPVDAQNRLNQAAANVDVAHAGVSSVADRSATEEAMIAQRQAAIVRAQAAVEQARLELERYKALVSRGAATQQQLQLATANAASTAASLTEAEAALEAEKRTRAALGSTQSQTQAQVQAAQALVAQARTSLDRTIIRAPVGGVIGARTVRQGQYVRPGAPILAIVPLGQTYVVANFKETQVSRLRIGQKVTIRADAFGGAEITGHVESFAPATGSEFALIPVENAVGNFTKIAQRLPVRIALDKSSPLIGALRPGLSVTVKVSMGGGGASFADSAARPQVAAEPPAGPAKP